MKIYGYPITVRAWHVASAPNLSLRRFGFLRYVRNGFLRSSLSPCDHVITWSRDHVFIWNIVLKCLLWKDDSNTTEPLGLVAIGYIPVAMGHMDIGHWDIGTSPPAVVVQTLCWTVPPIFLAIRAPPYYSSSRAPWVYHIWQGVAMDSLKYC